VVFISSTLNLLADVDSAQLRSVILNLTARGLASKTIISSSHHIER
jgi:hypothetical protein